MFKLKILGVIIVVLMAGLPVNVAHAKAHCFCKLGPTGTPFHDFGEIKTYKTQIGHDGDCTSTCNSAVSTYLANASNKTAACAAANGGNLVSYSAVGTRPYLTGSTTVCPQAPGGVPGDLNFGVHPASVLYVTVNNVGINPYVPPTSITVPINTAFTTFIFQDSLKFHAQRWTFNATLYRDGVKIEQFSKKSPVAFRGGVYAQFTGQPNAFVHGHTWKIEWSYAGPNYTNGAVSFFVN